MRCRKAALQPFDVQHPTFDIDVIEGQGADFRNTVAVPVAEKQQATVALPVPAALGGRVDKLLHLAGGEVQTVGLFPMARRAFLRFSGLSHFVESSPSSMPRKPAPNGQGPFVLSTK